MNKPQICSALLVVGLSLMASAAMADCQSVQARIGVGERLGPCEYLETQFSSCWRTPIRGTLNGTYHYYGSPEAYHVEWAPGPEPPPPFPDYPLLVLGWALDVFETNRGEVWAHEMYAFNPFGGFGVTSDGGVPVVALSHIVGGTGAWQGASGWLGLILAADSEWRGFIRGEICTPESD